ncbi:barstar family protein [Streptomyces sp. HPF1205]|uniref:barstar family protein n=1 Tax=Streptomyces sp. HPF1205 TaxID=2873262 RepID=UPI001CEC0B55|nr:barstar family protein [Streptomyces sp. HPF1205]
MPPTAEGAAQPLVLDLTGVSDRQGFMDRAAADLGLPGWFGRNWDALADCLADLSWWPPGPGGRLLHVRGWREYAGELPREWRIVKDILRDAEGFWRRAGTALAVVVEDDVDDTAGDGERPAHRTGAAPS